MLCFTYPHGYSIDNVHQVRWSCLWKNLCSFDHEVTQKFNLSLKEQCTIKNFNGHIVFNNKEVHKSNREQGSEYRTGHNAVSIIGTVRTVIGILPSTVSDSSLYFFKKI